MAAVFNCFTPEYHRPCGPNCPRFETCQQERREARKHYCEEGATNLRAEFIRWTVRDYIHALPPSREIMRRAILGPDFEIVAGVPGQTVLWAIKRRLRGSENNDQ